MEKMRLDEVIFAVNGKTIYEGINDIDKIIINGISTDTRKIEVGNLFIPLSGEKYDGHNFINEAFNKGAVVCLTEKSDIPVPKGKILILVENTKKALINLAAYYRSLFNIPFIAITGSVGKTSTKDMIASVLSQKYKVLKTEGNFNNEIGVPLTVFRLNKEHEVAVIEMGMNHFGEIDNLSYIVKPDIAVITNIGVSHIENLGSREGILRAKSEIFNHLKKDGIAVLNGDDDLLRTLENKIPFEISYFGLNSNNDIYAKDIKSKGAIGVDVVVILENKKIPIQIPAPGKHMVYNALSAIAVGQKLNLTINEMQKGVLAFKSSNMRMNIIKTNKNVYIINDVYNASPQSMKAAIDVLEECSEGKRKIAILGDMLEMGDFSYKGHKEVGEYIAKKNIDYLFCVGKEAKYISEGAIDFGMDRKRVEVFKNQEELWDRLYTFITEEDMFLIKASRGMHLEKTVEKIEEVK
ncbi:UDP-N-acetylmuramoyl-tripeptide--D-alanyl-D-alanine ligase [Defluviitalea phaphyphila]|uniref:UDP-N-acetylmuramoyl-tripeptide--D-alanyl-D- alanine ligase n=1 Tax=Defluviitalea phaphyphila TaxID=1473580 RepID=UPI0007312A26|nr:UDP-N-acetylmuramoyl-tripeptide--D-alanyl-D-alanine ligase [Defluviitalea phaphyphila]